MKQIEFQFIRKKVERAKPSIKPRMLLHLGYTILNNFLVATLLFAFLGCPFPDKDKFNPDSTLTIVNKSNRDILYYDVFGKHPDTSLVEFFPFYDQTQYIPFVVKSMSSRPQEGEWIAQFNESNKPMMLFIFSRDTIDHVPWDKIRREYNVLRRYDLTKANLDSLNWTITYP
jgi:hypothetical protein